MGTVYIKGIQVGGLNANDEKKYQLLIRLLPNMEDKELPITKTVTKNGVFILQSLDEIAFNYADISKSHIGITILLNEEEKHVLGRLNLPLSWFQVNSIVRQEFPIRLRVKSEITPMVSLLVHVSDNGSQAFDAPEGQLLVIPAWNKPQTNQATPSINNQPRPQVRYLYPSNP